MGALFFVEGVEVDYPKWIYHESGISKLVRSRAEHFEHLDWKESPADFEKEKQVTPVFSEKPIVKRKRKMNVDNG